MITARDIAKACGVSITAVNNALYRDRKTLSDTDMRIIQHAKLNGFSTKSNLANSRMNRVSLPESICPKCKASKWKVLETRDWNRIRMCVECNTRYWTREEILCERRYLK